MESLTKIINDTIKDNDFSGVIQINTNNKTIYEKAFGFSDRANKIKNNLKTRFGIASGTKLFTALGIMRLVEEKRLSLEDSPFDYIKYGFPTYDNKVTIRHLLSHTSGIPDYLDENNVTDYNEFKVDVPWYELKTPSDYFKIFPQTKMEFEPGKKFRYNNSAFVLLAAVIESITGDFYKYIEDEVLKKADMKRSGFFSFDQLPENTANGYIEITNDLYKTNIYALPIIGSGDGGMFTSLKDMNSFWKNLYSDKIISRKTLNTMTKPAYEDEENCYGLGLWLEKTFDSYVPFIVGEDAGVSFKSYYDHERQISYTIISNTTKGAWLIDKSIREYLSSL